MLIWFLAGLLIITFFRTKLEVYIMLILLPGVFIASNYIKTLAAAGNSEKILLLIATSFNIFWAVLNYFRIEEGYKINSQNINLFILLTASWMLISAVLIFLILRKRSDIPSIYYGFILVFLVFISIFYAVRIPYWENSFKISDIKGEIEKSGNKNLIYVASNYRFNPQFSFYFDGLDLGWKTGGYNYEFMDTKDGTEKIKEILRSKKEAFNIIVEKDKINRGEYPESGTFIPEGFILVKKSPGYELYRNNWK
jgi:hypothetical protein